MLLSSPLVVIDKPQSALIAISAIIVASSARVTGIY
jgi:hypothetical protein